jgi:hypothetical protein
VRSRPIPVVGAPVTPEFADLFERTSYLLAAFVRNLAPQYEQERPVFDVVREYAAGDVFATSYGVSQKKVLRWYGVFTAPSLVVRSSPVGVDYVRAAWGGELHVQFVSQPSPGQWQFFYPPDHEPLIDAAWWRTRDGLTLLSPDGMPAFESAFLAAMRNQSSRQSRENALVFDAVEALMSAARRESAEEDEFNAVGSI